MRRRHTVERLAKIRGGLIDLGLDAVLITDELNQRYAAGFAFTDGAVLVTLDRAFLLPSYIVNRRGLPEVFSDRARLFAL